MSTDEIELEGLDYIFKFIERAYITMKHIKEGNDIEEEGYCVFNEILRIENEGRLPFFKTVCTEPVTTTTEPDLFSDNLSPT